MIPTIFLEEEEIAQLTNRLKKPAQVRVLKSMGIEHKTRPDGSIVILRAHIVKIFDGGEESTKRRRKPTVPNFDNLYGEAKDAA